jgi:hypothetical protein
MTWALQVLGNPKANTTSLDSLLFDLAPKQTPEDEAWFRRRIALLTPEQVRTVCCFLDFLSQYGEDYAERAQKALTRYWGQFATKPS